MTSEAMSRADWLYLLQMSAVETTSYVGNDFPNACRMSRLTQKPVWEHKLHKEIFVVDVAPLQEADSLADNWHCHGINDLDL